MIEHLKSGLSISTHMGCGLKCLYCILSTIPKFNNGPVLKISPRNLVDELLNNCEYYYRNITPLMINNRTDPFLPTVTPYTLEILDLIVENKIKSPIIIISKFAPPIELKKYFNKIDILFFYSYSGIESDFNFKRVNSDLEKIKSIVPKKCRFHYFRPIIPGVNDKLEYIKDTLNLFCENDFYGSVIAGFRVTNLNKYLIKDKKIDIKNIDYSHKLVDSSIYNINELFNEKNYYIFRHTSCAIANHLHAFNKLNYYKRVEHCFGKCPNHNNCNKKNN